jgi:hypothetical protein
LLIGETHRTADDLASPKLKLVLQQIAELRIRGKAPRRAPPPGAEPVHSHDVNTIAPLQYS